MYQEEAEINRRSVWTIVDGPEDFKVLGSRWVLVIKGKGMKGTRNYGFVVKGNNQVKEVNVLDTFSPTLSKDSLQLVLAIASLEQIKLRQMDKKCAFLNSPITIDTYIELMEILHSHNTRLRKVAKLHKAMYGLRQAPLV
jgi:Reverse transcriptase (RNA-dependent DNA polymerase)